MKRFFAHIFLFTLSFSSIFWAKEPFFSKDLSLEEKIGQLLMVHFHGDVANEEAKVLIEELKVGSFIYYTWANRLFTPSQVYSLSQSLQKMAKESGHHFPLLIAIDQEMGAVVRLKKGFTQFPGNLAVAKTNDPFFAQQIAKAIGIELRSVGIHMNFAPVVDLYSNPFNPVIGIRSFGSDPELVTNFAKEALVGYQKAQVIATLKHFPGHGDVMIDSHEDLPIVKKTQEELERTDLFPFQKLAPFAEAVMTAHILVPSLDDKNCATLSTKIVSYLREKLGFQGLIISDSLLMKAVMRKKGGIEQVAVDALKAGCDLLLLGGSFLNEKNGREELLIEDIKKIQQSILSAVKKGGISLARIDEAVEKVLALKKNYCEFELFPKNEDRWYITTKKESFFSFPLDEMRAHQELADSAAQFSLKVAKDEMGEFFSQEQKITVFAPKELEELISSTSLIHQPNIEKIIYFTKGEKPSLDSIENRDLLLVFCYNAWKNPSQKAYIEALVELNRPIAAILLGDPQDEKFLEKASLILETFSPTACSIEAALDYLLQEKQFFYTIDSLWRDL